MDEPPRATGDQAQLDATAVRAAMAAASGDEDVDQSLPALKSVLR